MRPVGKPSPQILIVPPPSAGQTEPSERGVEPRFDAKLFTVTEIASELRCSKAHVHHLIAGKVAGVRPLPSLWLGRRRLIMRASFEEWLRSSEQNHG